MASLAGSSCAAPAPLRRNRPSAARKLVVFIIAAVREARGRSGSTNPPSDRGHVFQSLGTDNSVLIDPEVYGNDGLPLCTLIDVVDYFLRRKAGRLHFGIRLRMDPGSVQKQ